MIELARMPARQIIVAIMFVVTSYLLVQAFSTWQETAKIVSQMQRDIFYHEKELERLRMEVDQIREREKQ